MAWLSQWASARRCCRHDLRAQPRPTRLHPMLALPQLRWAALRRDIGQVSQPAVLPRAVSAWEWLRRLGARAIRWRWGLAGWHAAPRPKRLARNPASPSCRRAATVQGSTRRADLPRVCRQWTRRARMGGTGRGGRRLAL